MMTPLPRELPRPEPADRLVREHLTEAAALGHVQKSQQRIAKARASGCRILEFCWHEAQEREPVFRVYWHPDGRKVMALELVRLCDRPPTARERAFWEAELDASLDERGDVWLSVIDRLS